MKNIISSLIIVLLVLLIWFPSKIEASIINKYFNSSNDTTIIHTSFEADETPTYALGTINNQDNWSVVSGSGEVVEDSIYARQGGRGLKISTSLNTLRVQHTPFSGSEQGVTGIVYFDMCVKIISSSGEEFTINGYDLFGSSLKRAFVIDFTVPTGGAGSIRINDGWHKVIIAPYQVDEWYRLAGKINYELEIYQVMVDEGGPETVGFRESYNPTASGARAANLKEYHQLLFNLGTMSNTGSVNAAVNGFYVGTYLPEGVVFPDPYITYTVTVNQPEVKSIALDPKGPVFKDSTTVTASLTLPTGYINCGWTGDLSGKRFG